jgi:hypothetical protein
MFTKSDEALTSAEERLLIALSAGQVLKSHRYLSGRKVFKLSSPDDGTRRVSPAIVEGLRRRRLVYTNLSFPPPLTPSPTSVAVSLPGSVRTPVRRKAPGASPAASPIPRRPQSPAPPGRTRHSGPRWTSRYDLPISSSSHVR